ncbi:MAG: cytochrome b/b6 domain-containing protein [Candidatus Latescibacteria bacterium]|nr:cytochrome b/b6 domain-containing protein [Candidatus Latescibacterota bacterium]
MKLPTGHVLRLTLNERVQHLLLMVCVVLLMVSGLSLRFADTWFGRAVIAAEGGMENRGLLHRVAAVGVMVLWVYHALYVVFSERGHRQLMALRPRFQDARDAMGSLRLNPETSDGGPRFGWFDFREKFQYWAVAMGVTMMTLTGLVLWFESESMAVMPKWVIDVTRVVHGGEGLLIFVVLFLWHLYDTHLRPDVFPMDASWITGRMTLKELKRRHPLAYDGVAEGEDGEGDLP